MASGSALDVRETRHRIDTRYSRVRVISGCREIEPEVLARLPGWSMKLKELRVGFAYRLGACDARVSTIH
jgi:hypothetical protein